MPALPDARMRLGALELNPASGELRRAGQKIAIPPKALEVLKALLERPGEVVTRGELRARLWPADTFVEFDDSLNHAVKKLRQVLGDSAADPALIETLPRYGYRLIDHHAPAAESGPRIRSVAVLPFANLSDDPQQEYFADGMTDALITDLSALRALKVISRTSAMQYKGAKKPLPQIARELRVAGVIEGAVQRACGQVRVTVQLIDAATDTHVWAGRYERDGQDVLTLQGEVARAAAREIEAVLTPAESARLASAQQVSPEAYEAYIKGQFHWYRLSPGHLDRALSYFQSALEHDPNYASAHAGIANVWLVRGDTGGMPAREALPIARAAVLKALELDPTLAEGHIALANVMALYDWDWPASEREFRRAIELNPNRADGHFFFADVLISMKRTAEWASEMQRVLELDPLNPFYQCFYGWHLVYLHRCDDAVAYLRESLAAERGFASAHLGLWGAFYRNGRHDEALAAAARFFAVLGDHEVEDALRRGDERGGYSRAMGLGADVLATRCRRAYVPSVRVARLYAHAGENDRAMEWLQRAFDQRETALMHLGVAWDWDGLRGDARFRDLQRRVGIAE